DNAEKFNSYTDADGAFPYGGYVREIKKSVTKYPVMIDRFGLSTNTNAFEKETFLHGLSEYEQGVGIVRMMRSSGCWFFVRFNKRLQR
ncbi:MAG TPA: hypothetical protein PLZ84_06040, partial [Clostridia bacterium]|nr:hypothetical protein [Clostridia bacterium]